MDTITLSDIKSIDDLHPSYITDEQGRKHSVVLPIDVVQQLIDRVSDAAEDYELGKLVLERRSQKKHAIRVTLDEL